MYRVVSVRYQRLVSHGQEFTMMSYMLMEVKIKLIFNVPKKWTEGLRLVSCQTGDFVKIEHFNALPHAEVI